jgi:hypothetical protein
MREFNGKITVGLEQRVREATAALYELMPDKKQTYGADLAMDDDGAVVITEGTVKLPGGEKLQIAVTRPEARPPFEWLMEITSLIDEADYFKHYLIREHDIVLAHRRDLKPIDDAEAQVILADLETARAALAA